MAADRASREEAITVDEIEMRIREAMGATGIFGLRTTGRVRSRDLFGGAPQ